MAVGIAEGEEEAGGLGVKDEGEDLKGFQHAHYGGAGFGLNGSVDKDLDILTHVCVVRVNGELDGAGRRPCELVGFPADDDNALGGFRAGGEEFGKADARGVCDLLQLGEGGIAPEAGDKVGLAGAHALGNIGNAEAFGEANCPKSFLNVCHSINLLLRQRYAFVGRITKLFAFLLVKY